MQTTNFSYCLLVAALLLLNISSASAQNISDSLSIQLEEKFQKAQGLINTFQFDEALQMLSECYIRDSKNLKYLLKIAYCNEQLGRFKDARLFLKEAIKVDSVNREALVALAGIHERSSNTSAAKQLYQELIQLDSTNSYYWKRSGYMSIKMGKPYEAVLAFLQAHRINEGDLEAIDQLTNLYLRMDQLPYAEEVLEKGLRLDAENIRLLHHSARLNYKKKAYPLVVEALEQTMAIGDSTPYYQMLVGVSYLHLDSISHAYFHLNDLIQNGEETEHTHHYLGLCYREMDDLEKSIYHLEKAVALGLSPKIEIYHADLGTMEAENGQYKSAISHFQKAYDYSGDPEHLFHLARNCDIYYKDKSIALRHYKKYLKTKDSKYRKYTEDRILELKESLHFQQQ